MTDKIWEKIKTGESLTREEDSILRLYPDLYKLYWDKKREDFWKRINQ